MITLLFMPLMLWVSVAIVVLIFFKAKILDRLNRACAFRNKIINGIVLVPRVIILIILAYVLIWFALAVSLLTVPFTLISGYYLNI